MRTITIRLRDFVDETKRRERRGGAVIVAFVALTIAAIVARPAEKQSPQAPVPTQIPVVTQTVPIVTQTMPPVSSTAVTVTSAPAPPPSPARAVATPQALRFEPLTAGGSSAAQLVAIRNAGEKPLAIRNVASNGSAFRITNGCSGGALESRASCSVAVVFSPQSAGEQTGSLSIATNGGPLSIALRGVARPIPPVELAPLDFGRQQIGGKVTPQRVRFVNSGASPVMIGDVTLTGEPFSIVSSRCKGAVPPGGECEVQIAFTPRDGRSDGEIKLASERHLVAHASIAGAGFEVQQRPPLHLDIKPRSLHFLAGATPPQRITITNPNAEPIKIYSVRVVGSGRTFRVSAEKCEGTTLQPRGGSCVIVVGATASFVAADQIQILVEHSGADRPDTIGASSEPR